MKRRIASIILCLILSGTLYSGQKTFLFITAKSGLKLRTGPGATYKTVLTLPYNSQVSVIKYSEKKETIEKITAPWAQVNYYGDKGWIFSGFTAKMPKSTFTIIGKFTDASRGDCFHLEFRDRNNKTYDFGDGNNNFEFFEFFDEIDDGQWELKKKYTNKSFKIVAAKITGKVCEGCEGCIVDGVALTIIKLTVLNK